MKYSAIMRKTGTLLLLFMLISVVAVAIRIEPAEASPNGWNYEDYYASGGLTGYIQKWDMSYPPIGHSFCGTGFYEWVGQQRSGASPPYTYRQSRGYLSFDTSGIPNDKEVFSANLSLAIAYNYSDTDFDVEVYSGHGEWTSLEKDDWDECTTYEGILFTADKALDQYYNISIAPSHINKFGTTQFRLVSSREETEPSGDEYILFYEYDNADHKPILRVAYGTPPTTYYVDDDKVQYPGADFTSIQEAINVALDNERIIVYDGNYTENLAISGKTGLIIKSVSGAASTCIYGHDGVVINIEAGADDFTLGGADAGFTIKGATATFLVQLANGPSDVTIQNNILNTTGNPSMGISIGAAGASGLTIDDNAFVGAEESDGYIWGPDVSDVTVTDNAFTGPGDKLASGYAIEFAGVTGTSLISRNRIYNVSMGVAIFCGTGTSGLTISNNVIINCTRGVRLGDYSPGIYGYMTTVTVTGNSFYKNTDGIWIQDQYYTLPAHFTFHYNNFKDNTYGVRNENDTISGCVNAEYNWWGDPTGPYDTSNSTSASGDEVSAYVDYTPWLDDIYPSGSPRYCNALHINTHKGFNTIQEAINDVTSSGQTIVVYSGNYTENLSINNKASLTLKSASGAALTNITGVSGVAVNIQGGSNDFTLSEANAGFTINGGATSTFLVQVTNGESGVTIQYNILNLSGNPSQGISVGAAGASDLTIYGNTFVGSGTGDLYIWGPDVSDVNVTSNTFIGPGDKPAGGAGIEFAGVTGSSLISQNTIYNMSMGIAIFCGEGTSGLIISSNTIRNCTRGIRLGDYVQSGHTAGDMTTVIVTGNAFYNNTRGILIENAPHTLPAYFTFHYNNFEDNTEGVTNDNKTTSGCVDAEHNWWGADDGPDDEAGVINGSGDFITTNVDADPWIDVSIIGGTSNITDTGTDTFDAKAAADTYLTKTGFGAPTITCVLYSENPQTGFSDEIGKYYDVSINVDTGVNSLTIKFYYTDADMYGFDESDLKMYYWDKTTSTWKLCSNQTRHTDCVNGYSGYIEVTIDTTTDPDLAYLATDAPFAPAAKSLPKHDLNIRALNYDSQVLWGAPVHMTNSTDSYLGNVNANGWYYFTGISDSSVTWWIEWQGSTVWYKSSQNMGTDQTIEQHCKVTDVEFTAKDPGGTALSSTGCQWHIIVPNSSNYVYDGNPVTLSDLVNGTYNLRVKWLGAWACDNETWAKDVDTSKEVTVSLAGYVTFIANDSAGRPLTDNACYWYIKYPNGTTKEYPGHSPAVMLGNATYKLGVKWQGTYVISNQSWTKTTQTKYSINCSEIVDRTFTAKDDNDVQLWSGVTKFWITFPNGTTYTPSSNSSSITLTRLANGTYTVKIAFEGSIVFGKKSYTFVETLKDISFTCNVFKFVPVLEDMKNVTYSGANVYLSCPNGTMKSFTTGSDGKFTILQIQNGSFSILNVTYHGHKVNQTAPFNIASNLLNWTLQFNGLSINQSVCPYPVPLNSTFNLKIQLVYNYTGLPVPSGSIVGLLGASGLNATTDASGWATFTLSEWQPVAPYTAFGINESGYHLTYTMQNKSISIPWAGDLNILTLDSKGYVLKNASILITNETGGYWKTVYTNSIGFAHVEDALCQDYTIDVEWKGVEVGNTTINLNRAIVSENISCSVYYWDIRVCDLNGTAIPDASIKVYRPDGSVYGTYQTGGTGYIPQIQQIPEETYKVILNYTGATFGATYTLNQNLETQFLIALAACSDVPEAENICYTTTSTVLSITYDSIFKTLEIDVTGTSGTTGTLSIFIPNNLLETLGLTIENVHTFIGGLPVSYTVDACPDGYLLTISYAHSSHVVEVVFSDITLTATVKDANNRAIEDATIKLYREGALVEEGYTNDYGYAQFTNLATGEYEIKTFHLAVPIKVDQVTLTEDYYYVTVCPVYDLTVQVFDMIPSQLPGASVTASLTNGTVLFSGTTNVDGNVTFYQVPAEEYEVRATYFGASSSTTIVLDQNLAIQIRVPMLNMMTLILILFTVGVVAILIFSYYSRRREEKPKRRRGRPKKPPI